MSCRKNKAGGLRKRKSKLTGIDLLLCSSCYEAKYEPRYAVILAAREMLRGGVVVDKVSDCIKSKRYLGEEVTLRELL